MSQNKGAMKLSAYHKHTHTQIHIDIVESREGVIIEYEHEEGNINITNYFIKTLTFLLGKASN